MKKLLSLLAVASLSLPVTLTTISCNINPMSFFDKDPNKGTGFDWGSVEVGEDGDGDDSWSSQNRLNKTLSLKNQSIAKIAENNTIVKEDLLGKSMSKTRVGNSTTFTPYADAGIVEDSAEYILKEKGLSGAYYKEAKESMEKHDTFTVYNDLNEINQMFEEGSLGKLDGITLGFIQNAADTDKLVPMFNAAPSQNGEGMLAALNSEKRETEYQGWFNDRYRHWTDTDNGGIDSSKIRLSFGPFANSLWHVAWENNYSAEQLAEVLKTVATNYGTDKLDFYFAAPYTTASGAYFDSQSLLAAALNVLLTEEPNRWDFQLSLVSSTKDGVAIPPALLQGETSSVINGVPTSHLGDESSALFSFIKYLGVNFRLNLVQYLTVGGWGMDDESNNPDWEIQPIIKGAENTMANWATLQEKFNGVAVSEADIAKRMSVTPWVGRRAEQAAYNFTPEDGAKLKTWAEEKGIGNLSMFYISRDTPSEFVDNGLTGTAKADQNALNQNVRSGTGYNKFSFAQALNGNLSEEAAKNLVEATTSNIEEFGGIDYEDDIIGNTDLNYHWKEEGNTGGWDGPGWTETPEGGNPGNGGNAGNPEGGNPGGGNEWTPAPATGIGSSIIETWSQANPNRDGRYTADKIEGNTYFSPYMDAGLYQGNDMKSIIATTGLDHITLAFTQQVNQHNDHIEMSIAGTAKGDEGYKWWEQNQYFGLVLKPLIEKNRNNIKNIKTAYGGATTGGFVEKNPWDLALRLANEDIDAATGLLETALVDYQKEQVEILNEYGGYNFDVNKDMPKSIDFDIEGHAQSQTNELTVLARTLAKMTKADSSWDFSLTLPVLPSGLTELGYSVMDIFVKEYQALGLSKNQVPIVNLMLMDYGDPIYQAARSNGFTEFDLAKDALMETAKQLNESLANHYGSTLEGKELYNRIGATPMIGVNDTVYGVFTDDDARELFNWSQYVGINYIGMWSMNDDRGKTVENPQTTNPTLVPKTLTSHGLNYLEEYAFAKAFMGKW